MTKFKISILTVLAVIVTGLTFVSCETEENLNNDSSTKHLELSLSKNSKLIESFRGF